MRTQDRVKKLEKRVSTKPEVSKWIALNLYYGVYSTLDNKEITNQEYEALAKQPGVGLIIINRVDTPIPQEE